MKMIKKTLVLAAILALSTGGWAEDKAYLFDMGPSNSPVWPGFTLVTEKMAYTKERGFGVGSTGAITAALNVNPDDLCRDFLVTAKGEPLEFSLDVPNGKYTVCILSGDDFSRKDWQRPSTYLDQEIRIMANGREAYRKKRPGLFYLQDRDYVPGEDMYEKYFKDRYLACVFTVSVTNGQLNLSCEPLTPPFFEPFPVNAIMVYPQDASGQLDKDLAMIDNKRHETFMKRWTRDESRMGTPGIKPAPEDVKRGYRVFPVNYLRMIYPETEPDVGETVKSMETFASQGEREPLSFCIRPLKPLEAVSVEVSDLSSGTALISRTNIIVSVVRYIESPESNLSGPKITYWIRPYTLMDWKRIDIPQNLTKQYILEIKPPADAAPGVYQGTVVVKPGNAPMFELAVRFRVLPFRLERSPYAVAFLMGQSSDMHRGLNEEEKAEFFRKDSELLREYGFVQGPRFGGIGIKIDQQARTLSDIDFSYYDKRLELYGKNNMLPRDKFIMVGISVMVQQFGIITWIQQFVPVQRLEVGHSSDPRDKELFKEIARRINAHIRGKGLTPVFECGGELSNYRTDEQGLKLGRWGYGALRDAGVLTCLCGNGPYDMTLAEEGLIDYMVPNGALLRDEQTAVFRKKCKALWLYNFSAGRYGYGFFTWKKGATWRMNEGLVNWWTVPWNDLDGAGESNWPIGAEQGRDGLVRQIRLIWISEGIDDYDYLATCEEWIRKAEATGKPEATKAATQAKETLKFIADQTFSDYDFFGDPMAAGDASDADCRWSKDDFQKYRWLVAMEIIKLQKALADSK